MLRGRRIMETLAEVHERKKNKRHAAIAQEVKNIKQTMQTEKEENSSSCLKLWDVMRAGRALS